jgi:hypothetical protein
MKKTFLIIAAVALLTACSGKDGKAENSTAAPAAETPADGANTTKNDGPENTPESQEPEKGKTEDEVKSEKDATEEEKNDKNVTSEGKKDVLDAMKGI